ncbi:hypothetical protein EHV15_20255 [Paenibacillus oralis]|uniref:Inhibitor I9 domain-containing protein n=1 Tax=Paenibacillus oralis TaxID=2490856 RepID=A0A3P3U3Q9_9BACL|nr:hypothetical protein [Paenibacillus oralis]RRJ64992.1 hypothetical protein EHV15_20255 [Paenibacillus oralis]
MRKLNYINFCLLMVFFTFPLNVHAEAVKGDDSLKNAEVILNFSQSKNQNLMPCSSKESKILSPLQAEIDQLKLNSQTQKKFEVSIMLKYDSKISKETFIKQTDVFPNDSITDMNGFGVYSFFAELTIEQINELAKLDEISSISTTNDVVSVF